MMTQDNKWPHSKGNLASSTRASMPGAALHRVVIVGGGAGGLELAAKLGERFGKSGKAVVTLVEKARTHFWKPHLHEIAAGSMDLGTFETHYLAQANRHHFQYRVGEMIGLDRSEKEVLVAPYIDEDGNQVTPRRSFRYDTLVIAVGSLVNDFGTPGVRENAISLETPAQASYFHRRLMNSLVRAHAQESPLRPGQLNIAIIGAGATGVELAAQIKSTTQALMSRGLLRIDIEKDIRVTLVEAANRILAALPDKLSRSAHRVLEDLNIQVRTSARVSQVLPDQVKLTDGDSIPAELIVWAAGVKAPAFLRDLPGLECNRIDQLVVRPTLQSTRDDDVFAIGDCAACPWIGKEDAWVPPRAQAAHQQASHMVSQIEARLKGTSLEDWHYRDFGSLVSLGEHSTVGNLKGGAKGPNLWLAAGVARLMYLSLYKNHEITLHGAWKVGLHTLARFITRQSRARVKLH